MSELKMLSESDVKRVSQVPDLRIIRYPDLKTVPSWAALINNSGKAAAVLFLVDSETSGHWIAVFQGPDGPYVFDPLGTALDAERKMIPAEKREALGQSEPELSRLLASAHAEGAGSPHVNHTEFQEFSPNVNTCGRWVGLRIAKRGLTDVEFKKYVHSAMAEANCADGDEWITKQTAVLAGGSLTPAASETAEDDHDMSLCDNGFYVFYASDALKGGSCFEQDPIGVFDNLQECYTAFNPDTADDLIGGSGVSSDVSTIYTPLSKVKKALEESPASPAAIATVWDAPGDDALRLGQVFVVKGSEGLKGCGFFSKAKGFLQESVSRVKNAFSGARNGYSPSAAATLEKYKDWTVTSLTVRRDPVQSALNTALNLVSLGKWNAAKAKYNVSDLFHLGCVCGLTSPSGQHADVLCEKNAVINLGNPKAADDKTQILRVPAPEPPETFGQFMEKAQQDLGAAFFKYSALNKNNCQDFVRGLLRASGALTPAADEFIYQDLSELVAEQPAHLAPVADAVTDLGARVDRLVQGGAAMRALAPAKKRGLWRTGPKSKPEIPIDAGVIAGGSLPGAPTQAQKLAETKQVLSASAAKITALQGGGAAYERAGAAITDMCSRIDSIGDGLSGAGIWGADLHGTDLPLSGNYKARATSNNGITYPYRRNMKAPPMGPSDVRGRWMPVSGAYVPPVRGLGTTEIFNAPARPPIHGSGFDSDNKDMHPAAVAQRAREEVLRLDEELQSLISEHSAKLSELEAILQQKEAEGDDSEDDEHITALKATIERIAERMQVIVARMRKLNAEMHRGVARATDLMRRSRTIVPTARYPGEEEDDENFGGSLQGGGTRLLNYMPHARHSQSRTAYGALSVRYKAALRAWKAAQERLLEAGQAYVDAEEDAPPEDYDNAVAEVAQAQSILDDILKDPQWDHADDDDSSGSSSSGDDGDADETEHETALGSAEATHTGGAMMTHRRAKAKRVQFVSQQDAPLYVARAPKRTKRYYSSPPWANYIYPTERSGARDITFLKPGPVRLPRPGAVYDYNMISPLAELAMLQRRSEPHRRRFEGYFGAGKLTDSTRGNVDIEPGRRRQREGQENASPGSRVLLMRGEPDPEMLRALGPEGMRTRRRELNAAAEDALHRYVAALDAHRAAGHPQTGPILDAMITAENERARILRDLERLGDESDESDSEDEPDEAYV